MTHKSNGRLHVVFVSLDMARGGAQRVTSTLLQCLDRRRFRLRLCCLRKGADFAVPKDVPTHVLGFWGPASTLSAAMRLRRILVEERPDVIVSNVNATNLLTALAVRGSRFEQRWIPRVGSDPVHHDRGVRRWLLKRLYKRAPRIVVNARALASRFSSVYGVPPELITTVPNPTDFSWLDECSKSTIEGFSLPDGTRNLVAVGRLFPVKRYDLMLRAVTLIRKTIPVHLHVFGDGPLEADLQGLAGELGISDHITWHGFRENPFPVVRRADLVLLTSDYEGLPNTLIEAQGLGVSAVSTDCPTGPDEIIDDGVTGLLVPVGDATAVAEAAVSILGNEDRRRAMGSAARTRMRHQFDAEIVTRQWESLFSDFIGGELRQRRDVSG